MSSGLGYPDWQKIQQWLGAPLDQATAAAIGAGALNLGPYNLASWASIVLAIKPTGGKVTVTVKQKINGGPATLELDQQFVVAAASTTFEAVVLFGDVVSVTLQGDTIGETVDYAIYPSNTTTNAQVITNATINVQKNSVLVAAEQTLDFLDNGANTWIITDDAPNTRVLIAGPRIITGQVTAAGGVGAGNGYSVVRTAAGRYTVTFASAFSGAPLVVATAIAATGNEDLTINAPLAGSFQVNINDAGANVDRPFDFLAIAMG